MSDPAYLSESEIRVLVGDMIKDHEEEISKPKHIENQTTLKEVKNELLDVRFDLKEMKATQAVVMKFVGAGVIIWAIRQLVELVQTFHH